MAAVPECRFPWGGGASGTTGGIAKLGIDNADKKRYYRHKIGTT